MLAFCPKVILFKIKAMLDCKSKIYFSIFLNFNYEYIKQLLDENSQMLNVGACLEGSCFNGRNDLIRLFWNDNHCTYYVKSLMGACRGRQMFVANWILKQRPLILAVEIFYIVLKSHSDVIVRCFLRNINIKQISTREWSALWNAISNDMFAKKYLNLIYSHFKRFNKAKQFMTFESNYLPCFSC